MTEPAEPHWLTIARAELGVHEDTGPGTNPRVAEYLKAGHLHPDDSIAWCSAFLCWVMDQAHMKSTGRGAARSWASWGRPLTTGRLGAVTVLWREDPSGHKGHVGLWVKETPDSVYLLGGNTGNAVAIHQFPKSRVLAYRFPGADDYLTPMTP